MELWKVVERALALSPVFSSVSCPVRSDEEQTSRVPATMTFCFGDGSDLGGNPPNPQIKTNMIKGTNILLPAYMPYH